MQWLQVARADVPAFAAGFGADGAMLDQKVSFPWSQPVQGAVAAIAGTMYMFIDLAQPGLLADPRLRTAVLFKLVAHLSRTGITDAVRVRDCITHAAMAAMTLGDQPHLITAPVRFSGLVDRYVQALASRKRQAERARVTRPKRPDHVPPRPVLWTSGDGVHRLSELIHPWHLVEESEALGHCVGQPLYNFWVGDAKDLVSLPYWKRIASGQSRLFSLGAGERPLCTLNIELATSRLVEVQGRGQEAVDEQPYYPALVEAIGHLKTLLPGLTVEGNHRLRLLDRPSDTPLGMRALAQQLAKDIRQRPAGRP
jgi:hypothetical protein